MAGSSAAIVWTTSLGDMANKTEAYKLRLGVVLLATAQTFAMMMEAHAKQTAPWTDRTGMARASLWGRASASGNVYRVELGHGVYYGIFLERR